MCVFIYSDIYIYIFISIENTTLITFYYMTVGSLSRTTYVAGDTPFLFFSDQIAAEVDC